MRAKTQIKNASEQIWCTVLLPTRFCGEAHRFFFKTKGLLAFADSQRPFADCGGLIADSQRPLGISIIKPRHNTSTLSSGNIPPISLFRVSEEVP